MSRPPNNIVTAFIYGFNNLPKWSNFHTTTSPLIHQKEARPLLVFT